MAIHSSVNGIPPSSSPYAAPQRGPIYPHGDHGNQFSHCLDFLRRHWQSLLRFWHARGKMATLSFLLHMAHQLRRNLTVARLFSFPHLLVSIWVLVLLWGERWIFHSKVEQCQWDSWEDWPLEATPHHLIFVADPQLIDPHSYPGRPWPLSSLTITITDNYMRRSYKHVQEQLQPDTVIFLGDLFDGGREWKTLRGEFQDPSWSGRPKAEAPYARKWKKYGQDFWLREYVRFNKLFVTPWYFNGAQSGPGQREKKIIASLPGNHDVGFGSEVKVKVRDRFEAYFGDANRVDVIANHTFVSVDTVSLSARSSEDRGQGDLRIIYTPAENFLDKVPTLKRKAVERELRRLRGGAPHVPQAHMVEDAAYAYSGNIPQSSNPGEDKADLPTVLLSHVPLYRPPGTQCGPLREHWPPSNLADPSARDDKNAIPVSKGYQYQNVLSEGDSIDLINKVGNVVHAFSGDDHDYCELIHADSQANVKEITVKSANMAMGVATPGFLMVSIYNPIDAAGKPVHGTKRPTLQTHLCLLPSQKSTYARYGGYAFVCVVALAIRAFLVPVLHLQPFGLEPTRLCGNHGFLLPTFKDKVEAGASKPASSGHGCGYSGSSHHSVSPKRSATRDRSASRTPGMRANGLAAQARNASPKGYISNSSRGLGRQSSNREKNRSRWAWGDGPKIEINIGEDDEYSYDAGKSRWKAARSRRGGWDTLSLVWNELWMTTWRVLWMVVCFWGWLAHLG